MDDFVAALLCLPFVLLPAIVLGVIFLHKIRALVPEAKEARRPEAANEIGFNVREVADWLRYEDPGSYFLAFHGWSARTPCEWGTALRSRGCKREIQA